MTWRNLSCHWCNKDAVTSIKGEPLCETHAEAVRKLEENQQAKKEEPCPNLRS